VDAEPVRNACVWQCESHHGDAIRVINLQGVVDRSPSRNGTNRMCFTRTRCIAIGVPDQRSAAIG
jgi:hypothetical protein